jgi:hypothetical protein
VQASQRRQLLQTTVLRLARVEQRVSARRHSRCGRCRQPQVCGAPCP